MDLVWEKLSFGHVILAAPRRFGKTSVMYRLIDEPRYEYKLVHCDVEHFCDPADLLTALVVQFSRDDALSSIVSALSYVPKKAWSGFRSNVEEIEIHKLKVKLKEQIRPKWKESGEELFDAVSRTGHTVVFILDEFAVMIDRMAQSPGTREDAKTLLRWLRHLRQAPHKTNVRFLIAGSIGIGHVLNSLGEITSINDFEHLKLQPFTSGVADSFLQELSRSHDVPLPPGVRARILKLIGTRVPYFLQIMFSEISKAYKQGGATPSISLVDSMYRDTILGVDCKSYFDYYYGRLRDYYDPEREHAAKAILRQLAILGKLDKEPCYQIFRKHSVAPGVEGFNGLMANLENDFYISYESRRHTYQFSCKLLRDWWLRHYGMEE